MIDINQLKSVASAFASGITVVTTQTENKIIHGMTASSFLSVSFTPPLVLFSVFEKSNLFSILHENLKLGISILSADQQNISDHFSGQLKLSNSKENTIFDHKEGIPIIKNCLAWYTVKVNKIIPAGDHNLVLCEIIDLNRNKIKKPLLYFSQNYLQIKKIEL